MLSTTEPLHGGLRSKSKMRHEGENPVGRLPGGTARYIVSIHVDWKRIRYNYIQVFPTVLFPYPEAYIELHNVKPLGKDIPRSRRSKKSKDYHRQSQGIARGKSAATANRKCYLEDPQRSGNNPLRAVQKPVWIFRRNSDKRGGFPSFPAFATTNLGWHLDFLELSYTVNQVYRN